VREQLITLMATGDLGTFTCAAPEVNCPLRYASELGTVVGPPGGGGKEMHVSSVTTAECGDTAH